MFAPVTAGWASLHAGHECREHPDHRNTHCASNGHPAPPPTGAPTATTIDYVNVRSGPGTSYPVLVVAPPGATGEVTGKSSDGAWWQVKIPTQFSADGLGWVSADWVVTQNTGTSRWWRLLPRRPPCPATPRRLPVRPAARWFRKAQPMAQSSALEPVLPPPGCAEHRHDQVGPGRDDMRYLGAANNIPMHQGSDVYDLTSSVEPGWTYNFSVPMIAPFEPGVYGEAWQVVRGQPDGVSVLCLYRGQVAGQSRHAQESSDYPYPRALGV